MLGGTSSGTLQIQGNYALLGSGQGLQDARTMTGLPLGFFGFLDSPAKTAGHVKAFWRPGLQIFTHRLPLSKKLEAREAQAVAVLQCPNNIPACGRRPRALCLLPPPSLLLGTLKGTGSVTRLGLGNQNGIPVFLELQSSLMLY